MIQIVPPRSEQSNEDRYRLTKRLIEGLMLYRNELGELGYSLELLIRCEQVLSVDRPFLERIH